MYSSGMRRALAGSDGRPSVGGWSDTVARGGWSGSYVLKKRPGIAIRVTNTTATPQTSLVPVSASAALTADDRRPSPA